MRLAVASIRRQLKIVGIELELRGWTTRSPSGFSRTSTCLRRIGDVEPIVDAERLHGDAGWRARPALHAAALLRLRSPSTGRPWGGNCGDSPDRPRRASIIPLWQMTDHFAHTDRLEGIGPSPVTLYQDIENWQIRPPSPPGKP